MIPVDEDLYGSNRRVANRVAGWAVAFALLVIAGVSARWVSSFIWPHVMPSADGSN